MEFIEKDRHMTRKLPFFLAQKDYNNWLINNKDFNKPENTYISLGDWYHLATPKPDEIDETERFLNALLCKKIILAGNHDFSDTDKLWSIYPLSNSSNTEIILKPCVKTIGGKTFAFLPFYKHLEDYPPMKEYYTNLSEEYINADFVCYHFEDSTIPRGINISYLKGKMLGGHIHCSQKNYEIGMPIISRADEKGQENNLFCIDGDTQSFIPLPKYTDYYDINYGDELPQVLAKYPLWNIKEAPTRKSACEFYKDAYINDIQLANKKDKASKSNHKESSILEYFEDYVANRDDLTDESIQQLKNTINSTI